MNAGNPTYNHLAGQTSPYLLQHARNPVDWFPWGDEPFEKAQQENKLVLISIGYAACHWCHVMEEECFSDPGVARLMNEHYVCIKVDREQRPDIDHYYMEAVQLMNGSGGWPLNCFALPDGKPVLGGTYFPKDQWMELLKKLADAYRQDPARIDTQANNLLQDLDRLQISENLQTLDQLEPGMLKDFFSRTWQVLDKEEGGVKGAPKFPMPVLHQFLLKYYFETGSQEVLDYITRTLQKMREGGIYDQLAGGFARYSTDENWFVPHFEKMLYDNAQLASLYSHVYLQTRQELFLNTTIEILDFLKREMMSDDYLFYSSIDADSEGGEGTYYTWDKYEIDLALYSDADIFSDHFGLKETGNWKGSNVLKISSDVQQLSHKYNQAENVNDESIFLAFVYKSH